jgi:hypothetical protein
VARARAAVGILGRRLVDRQAKVIEYRVSPALRKTLF